ncbi:AI-2E family transporter [Paraflavisolibacter sp. H34]|uniref:AI-2E family transporter n=1 Tax=Huijunlia imazamoxiresistens TaxID=3127457 RepID=UPI00301B6605
MQEHINPGLYHTFKKLILYTAGIIILLWLLFKTWGAVLLLLFSLVMAIVLNAPVSWLEEKKKVKRIWASLIVFGALILFLGLLAWLIVPKVIEQVRLLVVSLPGYAVQLSNNTASWFEEYPEISKQIREEGVSLSVWLPSMPGTLVSIGNYSLSFLAVLLIFLVAISMIVYAVVNPRPLLETYFSFFAEEKRSRALRALQNTSVMLIGWFRANLIGGGIEAVLITSFLSIMNVPGAWVWGSLALVAVLIPKIGFYVMFLPPVLVALSESPMKALWVVIFYLVMDEVMGDFVMPRLRSATMNLHPVSTLFVLLAMVSAFGVIGALLAAPMAAIIKAFYQEFYLNDLKEDHQMDARIDRVIYEDKESESGN